MRRHPGRSDKKVLATVPSLPAIMETGRAVFGVLFLALPLLLVAAVILLSGAATFALTLILLALLSFGFVLGIAFVDWS